MLDIDNTICTTEGTDYENATPIQNRIDKVNELARNNHIVYSTSRGVESGIDYETLTLKQLSDWGCQYDELMMGKPNYDIFICDRAENARILDL
jgi:hypothetical protein